MEKYFISLCLILSLTGFNAHAEQENPQDRDRSQLKLMLGNIEQAINDKDVDALSNVMADDVVVTFLNGEVSRGIPEVRAYFEKTLGGQSAILKDYKTSAKENVPARFHGDVAMADGIAQDEFTFADGSTMSVTSHWSTTLVKYDDQWKVSQLHFSSNIFDNPLVAAAQKHMMTIGAIALVLGLIIGFLIGRKTAK